MKNTILILFFFLPLITFAQQDSTRRDTLILDKFFHFVGKGIKKALSPNSGGIMEKPPDSLITQKSKLKFGLLVSVYSTRMEEYFFGNKYLVPSLTLNYKRSFFALGPLFSGNFKKYRGVRLTYQLNPFREHKFLNFYLQYSGGFTKYHYIAIAHEGTYDKPIVTTVHETSTFIENLVGYGIRLNIFRGIYLSQSYGIGLVWNKIYYRYESPEVISGFQTNIFKANLITAGVGYKFK